MLKYILILIIFLFKFSKSDQNCVININSNSTQYSNNLCGYGVYASCRSIQDSLSSLSNLVNIQSCSSATLNLIGGIYMGKDGNDILFGNYDQLKLNNIKTIQVNGQSGAPTIIDGSGVSKNAFFGLTGTTQSLQFNFNYLTFENWDGEYNLFDIEIQNKVNNSIGLSFNNCTFKNIQTISIANVYGSLVNYYLQLENVNFNNIFTLSSPIISSNSYITMINTILINENDMYPFVNIINGNLKFYNCSIDMEPIAGENSTIIFINTPYEITTLCHCDDCVYKASNENSLNPTSLNIIDVKCPHKTMRFWVILISSIGAAFIIVCIIAIFVLNKKFGIIDIANKKIKSRKSRKSRKSYFDDDDDEQSSVFLNDSHL